MANSITQANKFSETETLKVMSVMFSRYDTYTDKGEAPLKSNIPLDTLVNAGLINKLSQDDSKTLYQLTPLGDKFCQDVESKLRVAAGFEPGTPRSRLLPEKPKPPINETITLNGVSVSVPNTFNSTEIPFQEYRRLGKSYATELLGEPISDDVIGMYWDAAFDESKSLAVAVKELVKLGPNMESKLSNRDAFSPIALKELATEMKNEFGNTLTDEQLQGALFMETFNKTGIELTPTQMKKALDSYPEDELEVHNTLKHS